MKFLKPFWWGILLAILGLLELIMLDFAMGPAFIFLGLALSYGQKKTFRIFRRELSLSIIFYLLSILFFLSQIFY